MVLKSTTKTKLLLSTLMALTIGVGVVNQHESVVRAEEKSLSLDFNLTDGSGDSKFFNTLGEKKDGSYHKLRVCFDIFGNPFSENATDEDKPQGKEKFGEVSFVNAGLMTNGSNGNSDVLNYPIIRGNEKYDYGEFTFTFFDDDKDNFSDNYLITNFNMTISKWASASKAEAMTIGVYTLNDGQTSYNTNTTSTFSVKNEKPFTDQVYFNLNDQAPLSNIRGLKFKTTTTNDARAGIVSLKISYIEKVTKKTVTFNPNAGEDEVSYSQPELPIVFDVNVNETIPEGYQQLEVHRQGYKFLGWFKEASAENKFDFSLPITEDTTIYAGWEKVTTQHKVTFDENGGTPLSEKEIQVLENSWIEEEPTTTKEGYKLLGWYVTEDGETRKWDFENKEVVTKDITLKAKWILNEADEFTQSAADSRLSVSYTKEESSGVDEFVKVTEGLEDWTGEYLIAYNLSETQAYVYSCLDDQSNHVSAIVNSGKISFSDTIAAYMVNIEKYSTGYSIAINYSTENQVKYMGYDTDQSNGINFSETQQINTISWDGSKKVVKITSESGNIFTYNSSTSNGDRFRYYKSSTVDKQSSTYKYVTLYKYNPGTQTNYDVTSTTTGYGLTFNANAYSSTAKYGMFLAKVDEANKDLKFDVETMDVNKDSDITLEEVKGVLTGKGFDNQQQYTDLKLNKTDEKGEILESGNYYTMGVKFTFNDIEKLPIDDWILAVGYMEVDGQIYFSLPTIHSLRDLVKIYQSNEDILQQPDAQGILSVLGAL